MHTLKQSDKVCVIFFDMRKAFDSVPHLPLLDQLQAINVNPYTFKSGLVTTCLTDFNLLLLRVRLQIDCQWCLEYHKEAYWVLYYL